MESFAGLNAQVLGISVDHIPCLQAWAESLGGINYPLLSDFWPHGHVALKYGVLRPEGKSERAIFVLDKQGVVRYIDIHDIDHQPDNEVVRRVLRRIDPQAAARERSKVQPQVEPLPKGGVVLYCTRWCPACRRARIWLESHNIEYTEVNVTGNPQASAQLEEWTGGYRTTPTFDIDGTILVDFDEAKVSEVLKDRLGIQIQG